MKSAVMQSGDKKELCNPRGRRLHERKLTLGGSSEVRGHHSHGVCFYLQNVAGAGLVVQGLGCGNHSRCFI